MIVRFTSSIPVPQLSNSEALQFLSRGGERKCYLGVRVYSEGEDSTHCYSPFVTFRMADVVGLIPAKASRGGLSLTNTRVNPTAGVSV